MQASAFRWPVEAGGSKGVTGVLWNMEAGRLIGWPRNARVQVLPSLPEAPTHSQPREFPPPASLPPAPPYRASSDPMSVDDEQTRVLEWRRHAKRQAEVALEDLDPAMGLPDDTPGGFGSCGWSS